MRTSSSAKRTCSEFSSASEYTATVLMPSSRQAKMIRRATSPRFAINIFLNIYFYSGGPYPPDTLRGGPEGPAPLSRPDREQAFRVLHRLPVLHVDVHDLAVVLGVNLVHQLHRLDDAEHLPFFHGGPDLDERV